MNPRYLVRLKARPRLLKMNGSGLAGNAYAAVKPKPKPPGAYGVGN